MNDSVAIIHFQPLEYYPPIQNIILFLERNMPDTHIYVVTTSPFSKDVERFTSVTNRIKIKSTGRLNLNRNKLRRLLHYLYFNLVALMQLCLKRPQKVFYVETLSSFPVFLYKKFINRKADVLIHYHEYTSPQEYLNGMAIARMFHKYEKTIYPIATWVSHTNKDRMQRFVEDIKPFYIKSPQLLPNYPPLSWKRETPPERNTNKLKIVYAGALGIETMYLREFAEWVKAQGDNVEWDIYSQQSSSVLSEITVSKNIRFKGSISYWKMPDILRKYDIGVILYKGHIPNFIFNAPNKLFEYLACDLDVWFPKQMLGSLQYARENCVPKIIALDFTQLEEQVTPTVLSHEKLMYDPLPFYCETVLPGLLQYLN